MAYKKSNYRTSTGMLPPDFEMAHSSPQLHSKNGSIPEDRLPHFLQMQTYLHTEIYPVESFWRLLYQSALFRRSDSKTESNHLLPSIHVQTHIQSPYLFNLDLAYWQSLR